MENPFRRKNAPKNPETSAAVDTAAERHVTGTNYTADEILEQCRKLNLNDYSPENQQLILSVQADMVRMLIHTPQGTIDEQYAPFIDPHADDVTVLNQFSHWHDSNH